MGFLEELTPERREALLALGHPRSLPDGAWLFRRGEVGRSFAIVREGQLEVLATQDSMTVVLGILGPGAVVGEVGFFDGGARSADVRARGPVEVMLWEHEQLEALWQQRPGLAGAIFRLLATIGAERTRAAAARPVLQAAPSDGEEDRLVTAERQLTRQLEAWAAAERAVDSGDLDVARRTLTEAIGGLCDWLERLGPHDDPERIGRHLREGLAGTWEGSNLCRLLWDREDGTPLHPAAFDHVLAGRPQGASPLAELLDEVLLDLPTPRGLRWRHEQLAEASAAVVRGNPQPRIALLSMGSGSLASAIVSAIGAVEQGGIRLLSVQPEGAQGPCPALPPGWALSLACVPPLTLASGRYRHGQTRYDAVVLDGVADTLPDGVVMHLLSWARDELRDGGRLIAGFMRHGPDASLFDHVLGWPLARREPRSAGFLLGRADLVSPRSIDLPTHRACVVLAQKAEASSEVEPTRAPLPDSARSFAHSLLDVGAALGESLRDLQLARLCVRALRHGELSQQRREALCASLERRLGQDHRAVSQLVNRALDQELRGSLVTSDLALLRSHYGPTAPARLGATPGDDDLSLETFAERAGATAALALVETLVETCAEDSRIEGRELATIREAAVRMNLDPTVVSALLRRHDPRLAGGLLRFTLGSGQTLVGRAQDCDVVLPDPQVHDHHALIERVESGWRVVARSERAVLVDGRPVRAAPLSEGTRLQVGPYLLELSGQEVVATMVRSFASLQVRGLSRRLGERLLLDNVEFTVFTGEVVAVVGPSGCGKTTLMQAITGTAPAQEGEVLFAGGSLHEALKADPSLLGEVCQDDLVLSELSVDETLGFAGRLRLPAGTTAEGVAAQVDRVVEEMHLSDVRHSRIGDPLKRGISGGQRKRVNVGTELLTRSTRLLFLDEPTSGLDPLAAQSIARLARRLADNDRLVLIVTHDLSAQVMAQFDHLLVLAPGGRLAFFGPPDEACAFFGVATPDAIFEAIGQRPPEAWRGVYEASPAGRRYFQTRANVGGDLESSGGHDPNPARPPGPLHRTLVLLRRYGLVKLRDRTGLCVLVAQPLGLAAVMALVFGRVTSPLIFMLSLSWLWFGMSAAVRELIADRALWRRERRVGAGTMPYLAGKLTVLGAIVALQAVVLTGLVWMTADFASLGFSLARLCAVSVLTGFAGTGLGLLVSAAWTSTEAAVGTLILLLVPQIAFSGIMMPLQEMNPAARALSALTIQRYALDASLKCGEELQYRGRSSWQTRPVRGETALMGLRDQDPEAEGIPLPELCAILCAWGVALGGLAGLVLVLRERRS